MLHKYNFFLIHIQFFSNSQRIIREPNISPALCSLRISLWLLDPRRTRPGESGEDGAAVEVSEKHSRETAEQSLHTERLVTPVSPFSFINSCIPGSLL